MYKTVKLEPFNIIPRSNGFVDGLLLKRELTTKECKHIMKKCLGIEIQKREDFDDKEEYQDYLNQLTEDVNDWIVGDTDETTIMEYAYDCSDEPLGMWNCILILSYLQKIEVL